jgi:hypothetical protein
VNLGILDTGSQMNHADLVLAATLALNGGQFLDVKLGPMPSDWNRAWSVCFLAPAWTGQPLSECATRLQRWRLESDGASRGQCA